MIGFCGGWYFDVWVWVVGLFASCGCVLRVGFVPVILLAYGMFAWLGRVGAF